MTKAFLSDATERVVATFVVAAMGAVTAALATYLTTGSIDMRATGMAALAVGLTAAWDVVKVLIAGQIGNKDSASLTP